MRTASTVFVLLFVLSGCGVDVPEVSVEQLHALRSSSSAVLIDVRTEGELSGELGRLEDAVNIPIQLLPDRISSLAEHRDDTLYVICRSGNRSSRAVAMLRSAGYTAFNVEGGMRAWRNRYGSAAH